jgi:hypothetical protein
MQVVLDLEQGMDVCGGIRQTAHRSAGARLREIP